MIRLDSIKVEVSNDSIRDYKPEAFLQSLTFDSKKNNLIDKLYLREPSLGIKNIAINQKTDSTEIEISAKVLREKYKELIHKDTIERVIDNINSNGVIEFDKNEFIDSALIRKIDVTNNLYPERREIPQIIRDLKIFSTASKYKLERHETGVCINARAKTNNERLILYSKYDEVMRDTKANRILRSYINPEEFKGDLRIESNFRKYSNIRTAFDFNKDETIYLKNILNSKKKINYNMFNKVFDLSQVDDLDVSVFTSKKEFIDLLDNQVRRFSDLERIIGRRAIVRYCDYDIDLIRQVISSKVKGNIRSYYIPKYKKLIREMRNEILGDFESIKEVRELLKVA